MTRIILVFVLCWVTACSSDDSNGTRRSLQPTGDAVAGGDTAAGDSAVGGDGAAGGDTSPGDAIAGGDIDPGDSGTAPGYPAAQPFNNTWKLADITVTLNDGTQLADIVGTGKCYLQVHGQGLDPLVISDHRNFCGNVLGNAGDQWWGSAPFEDELISLDVEHCAIDCLGHDTEPGMLGTGSYMSGAGLVTVTRQGSAAIFDGTQESCTSATYVTFEPDVQIRFTYYSDTVEIPCDPDAPPGSSLSEEG